VSFPPEQQYVDTDGGRLGFQTWGSGESGLVVVQAPPAHLDFLWTERSYVDQLRRLGSFARVVSYDRRGMGTSDPLDAVPTLEREVSDLEVVMDTVGFDRATIVGYGLSTPIAALFAATRPHRVDRLGLLGPFARGWDTPAAWPSTTIEEAMAVGGHRVEEAIERWGDGLMLAVTAPDFDTPRNRRLFALLERCTCSQVAARALTQAASRVDMSDVLGGLRVPTLVLVPHSVTHSVVDPVIHEHAAGLIPGAQVRHVQSPSRPTGMGDFWEPVFDEIEVFMTGHRRTAGPTRTYAVLLFTDIVSSTEHAARMGDAEWRSTLLRHNSLLLDEVEAAGGQVIDTIGDGALSAFEGPEQAIRCATRIVEKVHGLGIQVRAGVHAGECERVGQDLAGITVHVGARVGAKAGADEILITEPTRALLAGSGFVFAARGHHELKGVPGSWPLSAVTAAAPRHLQAKDTTRDLRIGDRAVLVTARRAPRVLQILGSVANRRLRKAS